MEINTKQIIAEWKEELKERVKNLKDKNINPKLAIIVAKDFYAPSTVYINNKYKLGKELDIEVIVEEIENWENMTKEELKHTIQYIVYKYSAVICQVPFPQLTEAEIGDLIDYNKDADGFSSVQKANLINKNPNTLVPCTALGVMRLLKHTNLYLEGSMIAIFNRSNLIGQPLLQLALHENMTPMVLHSKSVEMDRNIVRSFADIVVTGCGKRKIFTSSNFSSMTKVIIDCSMDKYEGISGVGDVDKEDILQNRPDIQIASGYGHTGPMTVLALFNNVIQIYETTEEQITINTII